MGLLKSQLFSNPEDRNLEACLVDDRFHITPGSRGEHVRKIQIALNQLSHVFLRMDGIYGPKTAAAVKAYKNAHNRRILQPWQTTADDIVGKKTIKSLDDEMEILENELPNSSRYVATTGAGAPHDHASCPEGSYNQYQGRVSHIATPINPRGTGRKINVGGANETKYLGFEDFVTDKYVVGEQGRPVTSSLPDHCASDICFRSAPITKDGSTEKGRKEILRIAQPGCRLTYASNRLTVNSYRSVLLSMGTCIEHVVIFDYDPTTTDGIEFEALVIIVP
jgi:peptidoglycan hydrolase-like protein with peptidoglycan-binding domain